MKYSYIPILIPMMPVRKKLIKYLDRIDQSRHYTNFGPLENELCARLATHWDVPIKNVVTACNATLALQGAVETSPEENVAWEVPSWTFIASPLSLHHAKVTFRMVDVDLESWRAKFGPNVEKVLDVLPFGDDLDLKRLEGSNIKVAVIDAAASGVTLLKKLPKSPIKYAIVISLHATKLIPAGEGAVFVTNCPEWAERFRCWTNFGFNGNRISIIPGVNAKLSEYSSAVALASLDALPATLKFFRCIGEKALQISSELNFGVHPAMAAGHITPYWIIKFSHPEEKIKTLKKMKQINVQTRDWWGIGCHRSPYFDACLDSYVNTDLLANSTLGLPMHASLDNRDLKRIEIGLRSLI